MNQFKRFWKFLKEDTWQSWLVSLILAFILIKFVFFPVLGFITGSALPLVVVESCSMYHATDFDGYWDESGLWYEQKNITEEQFSEFGFRNGLDKGDIILIWGHSDYKVGDVIVFDAGLGNPLIHRIVSLDPVSTKGDKNFGQLGAEKDIGDEQILGKSVARVPGLGWIKLIFFEASRPPDQRGFCK